MLGIISYSILIGHLCIVDKTIKKFLFCSMKSVIFIFIFAVNYYVKFVILYVQCSIIVM